MRYRREHSGEPSRLMCQMTKGGSTFVEQRRKAKGTSELLFPGPEIHPCDISEVFNLMNSVLGGSLSCSFNI